MQIDAPNVSKAPSPCGNAKKGFDPVASLASKPTPTQIAERKKALKAAKAPKPTQH